MADNSYGAMGRKVQGAVAFADNTPVSAADAIQITASASGSVTLTLLSTQTIVVNPAVGDNIYPYAVTKAVAGTAVVVSYYNLIAP